MGIEDRDWYRDAKRKQLDRDLSDLHYNPKQFRRPRDIPPSSGASGVWVRILVQLLALYGAIHLLRWLFYRFS